MQTTVYSPRYSLGFKSKVQVEDPQEVRQTSCKSPIHIGLGSHVAYVVKREVVVKPHKMLIKTHYTEEFRLQRFTQAQERTSKDKNNEQNPKQKPVKVDGMKLKTAAMDRE